MNKSFQQIKEEEVLFFDAEIVRASEELVIDSREYELYQKKTRNRETEEFLTHEELILHYEQKAALMRGFNKVVTIGAGFIKGGKVYIKALVGTEEEVIREFCDITQHFKYVCGANSNAFDLPMIVGNGMKHFNIIDHLPDKFNPSGKKPWELKNCIDLLEVFKGTHYYSNSLDDLCYHFGIESPKDDISGADVSRVYYEEGVDRIATYVKKDVFAPIQIFRKMQGKELFEGFIDRDEKIEQAPLLHKIYSSNSISDKVKKELTKKVNLVKFTEEDKENLFTILRGVYVRTDFEHLDQDSKKVIQEKEEEIKYLIEDICNS